METKMCKVLSIFMIAGIILFWGAYPAGIQTASAGGALYPTGIGWNPAVDYNLPNWSYSPNIRKFVDSLPGLGVQNKNNLGLP